MASALDAPKEILLSARPDFCGSGDDVRIAAVANQLAGYSAEIAQVENAIRDTIEAASLVALMEAIDTENAFDVRRIMLRTRLEEALEQAEVQFAALNAAARGTHRYLHLARALSEVREAQKILSVAHCRRDVPLVTRQLRDAWDQLLSPLASTRSAGLVRLTPCCGGSLTTVSQRQH